MDGRRPLIAVSCAPADRRIGAVQEHGKIVPSKAEIPEVVVGLRLIGELDYLIRVVSADLLAYQQWYESALVRMPGVRGAARAATRQRHT